VPVQAVLGDAMGGEQVDNSQVGVPARCCGADTRLLAPDPGSAALRAAG
jgi:hypothetical protein